MRHSTFTSRRRIARFISPAFALALLLLPAVLPAADDTYQTPPKEIADIIDAPWTPRVSLSPDRDWMLLMQYPGLPPIAEVAEPELRIGGTRINPRTNGPSRGWYLNDIWLRKVSDGTESKITGLPENPRMTGISWSPDGRYIAFSHTTPDHIELWLVDIAAHNARRLGDFNLNAVMGTPFTWLSDSRTLAALTVPAGRGAAPEASYVPTGPIIQQNLGKVAPARTYQDLLKNEYDEQLFDYYGTSQAVLVNLDGVATPVGSPAMIDEIDPSPDGAYLLVQSLHRPYSYTVPAYRFPRAIDVWDRSGKMIYQVVDQPLADQIPLAFGSVQTGRREVQWRNDANATLLWAEALDGGDASAEAEHRDRLFLLAAPFTAEPTPLITLDLRFDGVLWSSDNLALVAEGWWQTRQTRTYAVKPGKPSSTPVLIIDRSTEDRYNDPGNPIMMNDARGQRVLVTADKGKTLFLSGSGASPEGDRPFFDEFNVSSKKSKRLFRSEAPYYENPVTFIDPDKRIILTSRETIDEPPNYFARSLKSGDLRQLTFFPHPTPQLKDVQKEMITYNRDDGVQLTGTLYLPVGYDKDKDGPLPVLMWAYPEEYKSANAASQVSGSPYRFIRVSASSPLLWLAWGYCLLDNPSMPIIGEGDTEPNDTYVQQLVASAKAAVDELARRGVGDPERMAVGGHSYGAFMTANLLAHSDLFRAGIARSGAYNRTLTPFGFQSEERTLWQASDVYFTVSPFMHADSINEPLLMIHGQADNNSGTFPIQSERMFAALKALGGTARLVMLPAESHGYQSRESIMHMAWEMTNWLDTYVKNAQPRSTASAE